MVRADVRNAFFAFHAGKGVFGWSAFGIIKNQKTIL